MNKFRESNRKSYVRAIVVVAVMIVITTTSIHLRANTGPCGGVPTTLPFTDVPVDNVFFCAIASAYFSGLTNGTTATTYAPSANVPREQMAAFVGRTMDQSLKRGSKRAALDQYWTTQVATNLGLTDVGDGPGLVRSDGGSLWVANAISGTVSRVQSSNGKVVQTWTGATNAFGVLCAMGKVFVTGATTPGTLYQIDPTQAAGAVTTLSSALGAVPSGIAFDGQSIWTANTNGGSVSIITFNPPSLTNVNAGFSALFGVIYDGTNIWVTDNVTGTVDKLHKLDSNGATLLSVDVGNAPLYPFFDGTNIWVPNRNSNTVSVVRAAGGLAGAVLATLSGNGLNAPRQAAFDGERILVTNGAGDSVSVWRATDLTPIGTFSTGAGTSPLGVCADGLNFWITLQDADRLARF
jgi:hypothetical protein